MLETLQPWELLLKQILWTQLGDIRGKRILDFGSGTGVTACHFAANNDVTAVEPSEESVLSRWRKNDYTQYAGSTEVLRGFSAESFDVIFCHNVLEYAEDREAIVREFGRLLKPGGVLSIVKHNRPGRVMQMAVLLNEFERAEKLLEGKDDVASRYGAIRYYQDEDITAWCSSLRITRVCGIRTFWDLQQNQALHSDSDWQEKMINLELRVAELEPYRSIAFFHHILLTK